jgi:hypothetical protein
MKPTNVRWKLSEKYPGRWEVWHSYDFGFSWTMINTDEA